jgi:hypothetical protein
LITPGTATTINKEQEMATIVSTAKELGKAILDGISEITIEVDLAKSVIRIKGIGKAAWVIVIPAITAATIFAAAAPATGGTSAIAGFAALAPAVGILGSGAAVSAVLIAVGGGGIAVLNKLRKYTLTKLPDGRVLLKKGK